MSTHVPPGRPGPRCTAGHAAPEPPCAHPLRQAAAGGGSWWPAGHGGGEGGLAWKGGELVMTRRTFTPITFFYLKILHRNKNF